MAFTPTLGLNHSVCSNSNTTILSNTKATVTGALILTIACLIGIPGNIFVIWSILARMRRHSITTTLILNLACADGMLMLLTPFFIAYLVQRTWIFGQAMCKVLYYFCCTNMYASIFLIMLMSLHRLVAVVWSQHLAIFRKQKTVIRAVIVIWILALALSVPVLLFRDTRNIKEENSSTVCDCYHDKPEYAVMQYSMETVLGFFLPYSVILVSYGRVLLRIRRTRFRRHIRSEKLILIIVVTFGLFWLPYHVVNMLQVTEEAFQKCSLHDIRTLMRPFGAAVAFVSSCINPILYMCVGKAYIRQAGLAFMARLFEAAGRDSATRKSQNQHQEIGENDQLREKECESTTSANITATRIQNGKQ